MSRRKAPFPAVAAGVFLCLGIRAMAGPVSPAAPQEKPSRPAGMVRGSTALEDLEQALLEAVNRERAARNLPSVRISPDLVRLAREHSRDMAGGDVLSHTATSGRTFADRLNAAAVLYAASGENVARSDALNAALIHESLMNSPEHRANILHPDYDTVGIGAAAAPRGGYYVTQDFVKSPVPLNDEEARKRVVEEVNSIRAAGGAGQLLLIADLDREAQSFVREKAAGRNPPPVPGVFGGLTVLFAAGPDLEGIAGIFRGKDLGRFDRGGVGAAFSRGPDYPGGAFYVCLYLLAPAGESGPSELDRALAILEAVNKARARQALGRLALDTDFCRAADGVIELNRSRRSSVKAEEGLQPSVFFLASVRLGSSPTDLPDPLLQLLEDGVWRRIGISTLPVETKDGVRLWFAAAVVLAR